MIELFESENLNQLRYAYIGHLSITEESVMQAYNELATYIIFEHNLVSDHISMCLNSAKVVLYKKRIPDKCAALLLEPFKNSFVPKDTWFAINTFAKLRLSYDLSLVREPKKVIYERYKTLAIMTDPKMNVIKHTLEMWILTAISWRF